MCCLDSPLVERAGTEVKANSMHEYKLLASQQEFVYDDNYVDNDKRNCRFS